MKDLKVGQYTLNIDGYEIEYKSSGTGFPLILIHTHHPYAKYFLTADPKVKNYQVITIDIPGYYSIGQKKAVDTLDKFIDLLDKVFAELKFKKVDLLGECLGSVVVLKYAAKYPQRTRKSIVISLPLRIFDPKIKKTVKPLFSFLRKHSLAGNSAKVFIRFNLWKKLSDYLGGYHGFWEIFKQETLRVSQWNFDPRVFWGILADLLQININELIKNVQGEILFVVGDKDRITKRKDILKICQKKKNASCIIVPGANHGILVSHTAQFNRVVKGFLLR